MRFGLPSRPGPQAEVLADRPDARPGEVAGRPDPGRRIPVRIGVVLGHRDCVSLGGVVQVRVLLEGTDAGVGAALVDQAENRLSRGLL